MFLCCFMRSIFRSWVSMYSSELVMIAAFEEASVMFIVHLPNRLHLGIEECERVRRSISLHISSMQWCVIAVPVTELVEDIKQCLTSKFLSSHCFLDSWLLLVG